MTTFAKHLVGPAVALTLALLLLWAPAASPRTTLGTFPPGWWCGKGVAPPGLKIQLKNLKLTIRKGVLQFLLSVEKGDVGGDWEAVIATSGITSPLGTAKGQYALSGDGYGAGSAVHPRTVGTWHITGKTVVKTATGKPVDVPFDQTTKEWSDELEIDFSPYEKVSGHWLHPKWKWTARRAKFENNVAVCR